MNVPAFILKCSLIFVCFDSQWLFNFFFMIIAKRKFKYNSGCDFFFSLSCMNPQKTKKRLILFAGVLQLLEYGSVNHCTGLLLPVFEIMGLTFWFRGHLEIFP